MRRWTPLLLVLLLAALRPAVRGGDPAPDEAGALSRTQAAAVATACPGVVQVRPRGGGPTRSGVVIAEGWVVTCLTHLAELGDGLEVRAGEGAPLPATVQGQDRRLRLAVLEVPGLGAPPLRWAGPPRPGQLCLALGAAFGSVTATSGIVSAVGRFEGRALQTDAAQDASNTGGALVDLDGALLGVLVHVDDRLGPRSGVGFAIPVARIEAVLPRLQAGAVLAPGRLGIVIPRGEAGDSRPGIEVRSVLPEGAAARAGLEAGDRLLAIDGVSTQDRAAFRAALADLVAGQEVRVRIARGEAERELRLVLDAE